jgi:hypothetical protein
MTIALIHLHGSVFGERAPADARGIVQKQIAPVNMIGQ